MVTRRSVVVVAVTSSGGLPTLEAWPRSALSSSAIGRELAAKKTISTKISRMGRTCQVIVTLWDLKKATAEAASQVESKCSAARGGRLAARP